MSEDDPQLLKDLRRMVQEIQHMQKDIKAIQVFLDTCCCPAGYLMGDATWRRNDADNTSCEEA